MRRALFHFLLGGALLFAGRQALWPAPSPGTAPPSAVDDLLVEEGLRLGWAAGDPLIVRRLADNVRFALGTGEEAGSEVAMAARAVGLGMHRTDPVVRRRLIQHAEQRLEARTRARAPTRDELLAHLTAHPGRFTVPAHVRVSQLLVARRPGPGAGRGDGASGDGAARAQALLARLVASGVAPAEAHRLGDPLGLWPATQRATAAVLDGQLGPGLGRAILEAPVGHWHGPLRGSFGWHLVFVHERRPARLPALDDVMGRVRESLLHDRRRADRAAAVATLRGRQGGS